MPKIKHIAMTAQDPHKVAAFYMELFGMEEVGRSGDSHVYLSDGEMNLTIRSCKAAGDADLGEGGAGFEGIHHIGFVVDDIAAFSDKALKAGAKMLSPAKAAVGAGTGGATPPGREGPSNAEVKISGPNGVVLDMSETGWIGN